MNRDVDRILREQEAARLLGVSHRTLQRWRLTGDGPPFVRIGPRAVGYSLGNLLDWVGERTLTSTSEEIEEIDDSPDVTESPPDEPEATN